MNKRELDKIIKNIPGDLFMVVRDVSLLLFSLANLNLLLSKV